MYAQQLLERVLALTTPESYLALPPSPREIMRKGVLMRVATCACFVMQRRKSDERCA